MSQGLLVLLGTVKEKEEEADRRKNGRDNIKEWTGMDFASSNWEAENRTRWKGIVANSFVIQCNLIE